MSGWIEQTSGDECDLANRFNGFQDRTLGAGPILTYDKKLSQSSEPPASLRGIYEFDVKNCSAGKAYQRSIRIQMPFIKTSDRYPIKLPPTGCRGQYITSRYFGEFIAPQF